MLGDQWSDRESSFWNLDCRTLSMIFSKLPQTLLASPARILVSGFTTYERSDLLQSDLLCDLRIHQFHVLMMIGKTIFVVITGHDSCDENFVGFDSLLDMLLVKFGFGESLAAKVECRASRAWFQLLVFQMLISYEAQCYNQLVRSRIVCNLRVLEDHDMSTAFQSQVLTLFWLWIKVLWWIKAWSCCNQFHVRRGSTSCAQTLSKGFLRVWTVYYVLPLSSS